MRRRPVARAAMVGGAAYYAGKRRQDTQYREEEQEARLQDLEARQSTATPAAPSGGMSQDSMAQLKQLAELKDSGVLTEAEFEIQKQKILQGM
ncbi:MAG TPA: SHOCT domain-containing protein [Gaiellaceae bacterium]|nr:SHOCT domain-containing protein [Gaiellaceae bacterium]